MHTTPGIAGYDQLLGFTVRPIHARGETAKNQGEIKSCKPGQEYYFKEDCFIYELSNDPDDPEVSIARARVKPGQIARWHYLLFLAFCSPRFLPENYVDCDES